MPLARLLSLLVPPLCWGCGAPAAHAAPLCRRCRPGQHWLEGAAVEGAGVSTWAPGAYGGPAGALVGGLKFRGAAGRGDHMAAALLARAPPPLIDNRTLVPVPLQPARL